MQLKEGKERAERACEKLKRVLGGGEGEEGRKGEKGEGSGGGEGGEELLKRRLQAPPKFQKIHMNVSFIFCYCCHLEFSSSYYFFPFCFLSSLLPLPKVTKPTMRKSTLNRLSSLEDTSLTPSLPSSSTPPSPPSNPLSKSDQPLLSSSPGSPSFSPHSSSSSTPLSLTSSSPATHRKRTATANPSLTSSASSASASSSQWSFPHIAGREGGRAASPPQVFFLQSPFFIRLFIFFFHPILTPTSPP